MQRKLSGFIWDTEEKNKRLNYLFLRKAPKNDVPFCKKKANAAGSIEIGFAVGVLTASAEILH